MYSIFSMKIETETSKECFFRCGNGKQNSEYALYIMHLPREARIEHRRQNAKKPSKKERLACHKPLWHNKIEKLLALKASNATWTFKIVGRVWRSSVAWKIVWGIVEIKRYLIF